MLVQVLGNRAGHFTRLARGEDQREVSAAQEEQSISHEVTFDSDVLDPAQLRAELQLQAEAVGRRLRSRHLAARTVNLKVRDHLFRTHTRSRSLRGTTTSTQTLYKVVRGLLQGWLDEHRQTPVRLIGTGACGLELRAFEGDSIDTERQRGLDASLDEITGRFGAGKITHAQTLRRKGS